MILGLGNPLRRDDGAGHAVVEHLRVTGLDVQAVPRDPTALMDAWQGADEVWVVDAVVSGAPPGTLHRFDASRGPLPAVWRGSLSTHGLGLHEALELARATGDLPPRLEVIGIEAGDLGDGAGLSPAVAAAVEAVAKELEETCTNTT